MVANSSKISLGVCQRKLLFVSLFVAVLLVSCMMVVGAKDSSLEDVIYVSSEAELNAAVKNATPGVPVVIALDRDITLTDNALIINNNKDITLTSNKTSGFYQLIGTVKNMRMYTISVSYGGVLKLDGVIVTHARGYSGTGILVSNGSTLIMVEGEISNNWGGVHNNGHFIMYGGKISNNKNTYAHISSVTFAGGYGGGVNNEGKFEMFGGEITNNTADKNGGGIHNTGTFTMYGGKISDNTADTIGGGIHNTGTFKKRGGEIINNTAPEGNNIYSPENNSWPSMVSICVSIVFVCGIVGGFYFYESKKRKNHKG